MANEWLFIISITTLRKLVVEITVHKWVVDRFLFGGRRVLSSDPRPLRWWNKFLLFQLCHSAMGLTRCYKTAVVLHLYLLFFYHNLCLTYMLPVLKTKPTLYCNFISGSDFDQISSAASDFASAYQISSILDHLWLSYDVISTFQGGSHRVGNLHPVTILMSSSSLQCDSPLV